MAKNRTEKNIELNFAEMVIWAKTIAVTASLGGQMFKGSNLPFCRGIK
jgi:hypothetical protein